MMVGLLLQSGHGALGQHALPCGLYVDSFLVGRFLERLHQGVRLRVGLVYLGVTDFAVTGDDFGEAEQLDTVIVGIGLF